MGDSSYRYVVNAVGKSGETYLTHCQNKHDLKKWIADHEQFLLMNELKILDKNKNFFTRLFSLIK